MNMTRTKFLKAILAVFAAPLVPRPEAVELKPVDLDLDQIEGDTRLKFNQGHVGQILVYDGQMMQWQYPVTWTSGTTSTVVWQPSTSTSYTV